MLRLLDDRLGEGLGVAGGHRLGRPHREVEHRGVVQVLLVVVLRGRIAAALLGERVDDDGAVELGGVAHRHLQRGDVVPVDRTHVADAERLEERRRLEVLPDGGLERLHALLGLGADERQVAKEGLHAALPAHVDRVQADRGEAVGELRDRRRVGAAVVVEDDDDVAVAVTEVVERLVGHAPGQRAVADDGDDVATARVRPAVAGDREAVGVGEDRRRVAVLDEVVLRLLPRRDSRTARRPGGAASKPAERPVTILCT